MSDEAHFIVSLAAGIFAGVGFLCGYLFGRATERETRGDEIARLQSIIARKARRILPRGGSSTAPPSDQRIKEKRP